MIIQTLWQFIINNLELYFIVSFVSFFVFIDELEFGDIIATILVSIVWPFTYIVRFLRYMRTM